MSVKFITGTDPIAIFKDADGATIKEEHMPNVGIKPNSIDADETNDAKKWFRDRGWELRMQETHYSPQPASSATFAGQRYELFTEPNRREIAVQHATARGGRLLTLESAEEADFIGKHLLKDQSADGVWLHASDDGWEGNWKWESGPLAGQRFWSGTETGSRIDGNFAVWNNGEPNNARGIEEEDCAVAIWKGDGVAFNDVPCLKRHFVVIEFDGQGGTPSADSADETCAADGTGCKTDEAPRMKLNEEL